MNAEKKALSDWLEEIIGALRYCMRDSIGYVAVPMTADDLAKLEALQALLKEKPKKETLTGAFKAYADKQSCPALTDALTGFCELRVRKRKPLTERAMSMLVKKLEAMSGDPAVQAAIVNRAVENGWTGIYDSAAVHGQPAKQSAARGGSSFETDEFFEAALNSAMRKHMEGRA